MKLEQLCIQRIKEALQQARERINGIACRAKMGEALGLDDWEPISIAFDEAYQWIEAYQELRALLDIIQK